MNKGRVSEKEGSHRRQSLTEARVSQRARPHRSQGLTEGKVSQRAKLHRKQGVSLTAGTRTRHGFTSETKAWFYRTQGVT